ADEHHGRRSEHSPAANDDRLRIVGGRLADAGGRLALGVFPPDRNDQPPRPAADDAVSNAASRVDVSQFRATGTLPDRRRARVLGISSRGVLKQSTSGPPTPPAGHAAPEIPAQHRPRPAARPQTDNAMRARAAPIPPAGS